MKTLKKKPIQIYIEPRHNSILAALAKKKGISKAKIIRESLESYLQSLPVDEDPAMGIIGLGCSGKKDVSKNHDRYIAKYSYSKKK